MADREMDPQDRNDRAVHLQMIQGVIARMGQNAHNAKTWSVTVVAAMFAFAPADAPSKLSAWLVLLPVLGFWWLDAYYLRQERLYRALYDAVVGDRAPVFTMDIRAYVPSAHSVARVGVSESVWPVHVLSVAAVAVKALIVNGRVI